MAKQIKETVNDNGSMSLRLDPLTATPVRKQAGIERIEIPLKF